MLFAIKEKKKLTDLLKPQKVQGQCLPHGHSQYE